MSCCFGPPRAKYDFSGEQPPNIQQQQQKNKKSKKKSNSKNASDKNKSKNKATVLSQPGDIDKNDTESVDGQIVNENKQLVDNVNKEIDETQTEKQEVQEKTELLSDEPEITDDVDANGSDKHDVTSDIADTSITPPQVDDDDIVTNDKAVATATADVSDVTSVDATTRDDNKTAEDNNNNNNELPKKQVFVISRAKTNSFYGTSYLRQQQDRQKKEEERIKVEEERSARQLLMRNKLSALKSAHASPKIEIDEVVDNNKKKQTMIDTQSEDEPAPDYSDDDDQETKEEDYVELRKTVKNRISTMLAQDEWDQILDRSGLDELEDKGLEIPVPDYEGATTQTRPLGRSHTFNVSGLHADGMKRTPPENKARVDLHREMMMNKKFGIDVLHKKSELQREFTKRKDKVKTKEQDSPRRNSFEIKLQQMATKIQKKEEKTADEKPTEPVFDESQPEFLRVHSKINKSKSKSTS